MKRKILSTALVFAGLMIACSDAFPSPARAGVPENGAEYAFIGDIRPYSVKMMMSEMLRNPQATWLDGRQGRLKWNYTTGLELKSFLDVAHRYDLPYAVDYVRDWADTMATDKGKVYGYEMENYNLDHICPARIYFDLYSMTGDQKYRRVLREIRKQLEEQIRRTERQLTEGFSEEELDAFFSYVRRFNENLAKIG